MFKSIAEKVIVSVVAAIAIAAIAAFWTSANRLAGSFILPKGAIVAFDGECPAPQWMPFRKGSGRFLIGAADESDFDAGLRNWQKLDGTGNGSTVSVPLSEYKVGVDGGEEAHILSIPEMPSHDHPQTWGQGAGDPNIRAQGEGVRLLSRVQQGVTLSTGGGVEHNNLPPYIAVRFCEKT